LNLHKKNDINCEVILPHTSDPCPEDELRTEHHVEDSDNDYDDYEIFSQNFEVPSLQVCTQAIGLGQASHIKPFLVPDTEFYKLISRPRLGDWLDENKERCQTFMQFKKKYGKLRQKKQRTIYLLPIGNFAPARAPNLHLLEEFTSTYFSTCVRLLPKMDCIPGDNNHVIFSYNGLEHSVTIRTRTICRQLLTGDIHHFLKLILREYDDAFCICGVTMEDLYCSDDSNFVFGQAAQNNFVGVFSFARYSPHFALKTECAMTQQEYNKLVWRSCSTLAHEIAHLYGLDHCLYFQCIMNGANSLEEQDSQPCNVCPVCVHKLCCVCGWDIKKREVDLLLFYQNYSGIFEDERSWLERRLRKLNVV